MLVLAAMKKSALDYPSTLESVESMFRDADQNGDGQLSIIEWCVYAFHAYMRYICICVYAYVRISTISNFEISTFQKIKLYNNLYIK